MWLCGPGFKHKNVLSSIVPNSQKPGSNSKTHRRNNELINDIKKRKRKRKERMSTKKINKWYNYVIEYSTGSK